MWTYSQSDGKLWRHNEICGVGFSGKGVCKNDTASESKHNLGPIPRGLYRIDHIYDSHDHGPFCLALVPDINNRMYGRSGFLIHGRSVAHPADSSEGCIILDRPIREQIWESGDRELEVIDSKGEL